MTFQKRRILFCCRSPFCYVDDLIDGLIQLMATGESVTGPINIGNPIEFSILELVTWSVPYSS